VAVSKPKYRCDGFYPIEAADIMHAAQLFAVQMARREYGLKGRCRSVQLVLDQATQPIASFATSRARGVDHEQRRGWTPLFMASIRLGALAQWLRLLANRPPSPVRHKPMNCGAKHPFAVSLKRLKRGSRRHRPCPSR
jgi:hypothetical protein